MHFPIHRLCTSDRVANFGKFERDSLPKKKMDKEMELRTQRNTAFKAKLKLRPSGGPLMSLLDFEQSVSRDIRILQSVLPVIGGGEIELLLSKVPNGGLGLFARRDFVKNEIVTFYDGAVITYQRPDSLDPTLRTHARGLFAMSSTILGNVSRDGRKMLRDVSDFRGYGGGSMLNDSRTSRGNNVDFEHVDSEANELDPFLRDPHGRLIVIVANRNIRPGEEFFVSYGESYWTPRAESHTAARGTKFITLRDVPSLLVIKDNGSDAIASRPRRHDLTKLRCAVYGCENYATGLCNGCLETPYCSHECFFQSESVHTEDCLSHGRR